MNSLQNSNISQEHFEYKETIITIFAEKEYLIEIAKNKIIECRREIEDFIIKNPDFKEILIPFNYKKTSPEIIKKMCRASKVFNIGPMSTVAAVIAEYALDEMISNGAKHAIIDNGGDLALFTNNPVTIGIYTGNKNTNHYGLIIPPTKNKLGICTSSGKIGPSLSFGNTDTTTILSHNICLADAAATAIGNIVIDKNDIKKVIEILSKTSDINGSIITIKDNICFWGDVPRIVPVNVPFELITRGRYYI